MKKKIVYGLVVVMSVAMLSGCGTREEKVNVTLEDVLSNTIESVVDIESMEFDMTGKLDGAIEMEGEKMSGKATANLEGVVTTKDPSMHITADCEYNANYNNTNMNGTHKFEIYGEDNQEEGLFCLYSKLDNEEWECKKEMLSDFTDSMGEFNPEEIKEAIEELQDEKYDDFVKLNDTFKTINGKKCYLVYADVDKDDMLELMEGADVEEFKAFEVFDISYKVYLDKETYYPIKISFDMEIKGKSEEEGVDIDVKELSFELNTKINDTKTVAVPDEVKESASETVSFEDGAQVNISDLLP